MTQVPPPTSRAMGSPDDDVCTEIITSGDREGDICGRDLPCRFHGDE